MINPLAKYRQFLENIITRKLQAAVNGIKSHQLITDLSKQALHSTEKGVSSEKYCNENIIVSLTSYSTRIFNVHLTVESLLNQTLKPNKIILWLNEPFNFENIPLILKKQVERGLEVRFVRDLRSYDKLIHALKEFPNDTIITCDDDILYPFDFVERLVIPHLKEPGTIFFYRGHQMVFDVDKNILPYKKWNIDGAVSHNSLLNFPNGGAGTLYPPNSLSENVHDEETFMELAPDADDIWFRAMSLKKGTLCKKIILECHPFEKMTAIGASQNIALWRKNVEQEGNDRQLKAVFEKYRLFEKIHQNS